MKIYTFLNDSYDVIAIVKAEDYEASLMKVKDLLIDENTKYYSEHQEESEYYHIQN